MARQIDLDHTPDKDGGLNDYTMPNGWEPRRAERSQAHHVDEEPKTLKRLETLRQAYDTNRVAERPEQFNGRTAQPIPNPNPARRCLSSKKPN